MGKRRHAGLKAPSPELILSASHGLAELGISGGSDGVIETGIAEGSPQRAPLRKREKGSDLEVGAGEPRPKKVRLIITPQQRLPKTKQPAIRYMAGKPYFRPTSWRKTRVISKE
ncbi:hypothetical protein FRB90_011887 [Tulasnella sp. 427]|nr:hypothetical protein FRB90_011887 [Tulasnella sp. 427]